MSGRMFTRFGKRAAPPQRRPATDGYTIPRLAFYWLLAAVVSVLLPHVLRMPLWLTSLCALCILGRVLIYQGRMSLPGNKLKLGLVVVMVVLILAQFGRNVFSTDATVGVLLVGITLKLLEMQQRRDVLMVIYLCYFTVVAEFIYSQSIPIAFYMTFAVIIITSALMALNQTQGQQKPWRTFTLSAAILAQSVPLMTVFFLLFPRISPLWSVPLQTSNGTTGLSENMEPGAIGDLTRSAELAFRVQFKGEAPDYSELYWRALTLDEFNGRQWRRGFIGRESMQNLAPGAREVTDWYRQIRYLDRPIDYNIILEPTYENWIYTLQMPQVQDDRFIMRRDYQVDAKRRINQRYTYDVRSWLSFDADSGVEGREQRRSRVLPSTGNERAREFASELRAQSASDLAYAQAVLDYFNQQQFFYTLNPPTLGENPVDEFLFDTRQGFCEHFSSAFTYLMRAAGIPARVVTGYMGGEFNPYDGTLVVRQYDAHAWSEIWLPGEGWRRVDPTAAVAPERVNQGSNSVLQAEEEFLGDEVFTLVRFRDSLFLNSLRYRLEMIDYAWNRFVLNYNQDTQSQLFARLFGSLSQWKVVLVVVAVVMALVAFVGWVVFRRSARAVLPPLTRHYLHYCDYLASRGFARQPGETATHYLERVAAHNPQWRSEMEAITHDYQRLAYAQPTPDPQQLRRFRQRVRQFRLLN